MALRDRLRAGIIETAGALGIDPVDLATAISYETAGTFDPTKSGPTTQWGTHRGLIQFGEPQAQKYGVDWDDPLGSQLGPKGAVANYLRDTGVKPGMGLLDIYSAINAGGVGRYNASDANNGGAPGTVRDKVEQQMAAHRQKALGLLGAGQGEFQQQPVSGSLASSPEARPSLRPALKAPAKSAPQGLLASLGATAEETSPLLSMLMQQGQPTQMMQPAPAAPTLPSLAEYISGFLKSRLS